MPDDLTKLSHAALLSLALELRKYEALYAEARESLCSCNHADSTAPAGSSMNYTCEWCEEHPEGAAAPDVIKRMWKFETELAQVKAERDAANKRADKWSIVAQEYGCSDSECVSLKDRAEAAELREKGLREALSRMLISFVGQDEEFCMECGEKQGSGQSCETCYVIGLSMAALSIPSPTPEKEK